MIKEAGDSAARPEPLLWLDDHRGQYIPRDFAKSFADRARDVHGVSDEEWAILERGPDGGMDSDIPEGEFNDFYWDAWQDVCDNATVTSMGITYHVYQDGACWLIPDGMEWSDSLDFFTWPDDDDSDDDETDNEESV